MEEIRFVNKERTQFFAVLRQRVDGYFTERGISKKGDWRMYLKSVAMLSMYIVPFILILTVAMPPLAMLACAFVMGVGVAGVGLSVMHDAKHGGYSMNSTVNTIMGYSMNLVGGHDTNWEIQHNILHHTYTNIHSHDEDLEPEGAMRFAPTAKHKWFFKYQHLYGPLLYGLMTFFWVFHKDYKQILRYAKRGHLKMINKSLGKELLVMTITKSIYYAVILGLPVFVLDIVSFGQWAVGFALMHYTAGLILALVFQAAHLIEEVDFPEVNDEHNIENEWAIHQMQTTANFARSKRILSWYVGGLNYQVEHHLFPLICHVHYRDLSEIVKATAEEFGVPYHDEPTFLSALKSHFSFIKKLGQKDYVHHGAFVAKNKSEKQAAPAEMLEEMAV